MAVQPDVVTKSSHVVAITEIKNEEDIISRMRLGQTMLNSTLRIIGKQATLLVYVGFGTGKEQ